MATEQSTGSGSGDINRPFRFQGANFHRWRQKMLFYLTMKKLAYTLESEAPILGEDPTDQETTAAKIWKEDDFLCKNYILNGIMDLFYNYYSNEKNSVKTVWDALQKKYDTKEAGAKKYAVRRYLRYLMTHDKSVEVQSHELQKIAHEIISEGLKRRFANKTRKKRCYLLVLSVTLLP
ncbi:hypothetical protein LINGRAHAP2_LOCUS23211 [Linum grandiflorum]